MVLKGRIWTSEEDDYICKYHNIKNIFEIAKDLKRSKKAIYNRISFLGITNQEKNCWNTESYSNKVKKLTDGEYEVLGEYIDFKTKILTRHNTCGNEWYICPDKFLSGRRCPICANKRIHNIRRNSQKEIEYRISQIDNGTFHLIGNYVSINDNITLYHDVCGNTFSIKASNFLNRKRCNCCFKQQTRLKSNDTFLKEVQGKYDDEYIPLEPYINCKTKIKVLHKTCGCIWEISPSNLLRGYGCPKCDQSKGEKRIAKFLSQNNIDNINEFRFDDCRYKYPLPFDFYLPNYNCCIEYDGEQHYRPIEHFGGYKTFEEQKSYDSIKNEYCKKHKIKLIRITYCDFDNIEIILNEELLSKEVS